MVVADVSRDGRIQVVDRVKEMVRLGRHAFLSGRLTPEGDRRLMQSFTILATERAQLREAFSHLDESF